MTISMEVFTKAHGMPLDHEKTGVIGAKSDASLFVVAGPGTGKTACLTLRVLKLVYVDQIDPAGIIATTFTRKAAGELRSRILGLGFTIRTNLLARDDISPADRAWIEKADINQMYCGTIDSLCDQLLTQYRPAGADVLTTVDEYAARTLLLREQFLFQRKVNEDKNLEALLMELSMSGKFGWNLSSKVKVVNEVSERLLNDMVDRQALVKGTQRNQRSSMKELIRIIEAHEQNLRSRGALSYSGMASEVLNRLKRGQLDDFTAKIQAVLVDEYQDTNLLQESLYFELGKAAKGALTVVGDDDQSMYRFRGATVELFRDFGIRFRKVFKKDPSQHFLRTNYRSTPQVVSFVNDFATLDREFQSVRVKGKPSLIAASSKQGPPILGVFRDSQDEILDVLTDFLDKLFHKSGFTTPSGVTLKPGLHGAVGDVAFLVSSPKEEKDKRMLFPGLLRERLANLKHPIEVFNPRGQALSSLPNIRLLMGLMLECVDPLGDIQNSLYIPREIKPKLEAVREEATDFYNNSMSSSGRKYVDAWENRLGRWPRRSSLLDLVYSLATFLPDSPMNNPELVVQLEAVARQIGVLSDIGSYNGQILYDRENGHPTTREKKSIQEAIRDGVLPVLDGSVELDEDLLPIFPRDRIAVLSIHQSKGLEFPVVIVDVGAAFKTNHHGQKFKRFPEVHSAPQQMENRFRPFSSLGLPQRDSLDRTFDDLIRQYFVAFSRPESVLILIGTKKSGPNGSIMNVATGWDRDGNQQWSGTAMIEEL